MTRRFSYCKIRTSLKIWICRTTCTQHLTSVEDKSRSVKYVLDGENNVISNRIIVIVVIVPVEEAVVIFVEAITKPFLQHYLLRFSARLMWLYS